MLTTLSNEPALRQFAFPNGKAILSIVPSGAFFRFVEDRELYEPPSTSLDGYAYWSETHRSGLYATADEAEAEARQSISWLIEDLGSATVR